MGFDPSKPSTSTAQVEKGPEATTIKGGETEGNLVPTEICFDPVLLHAVALRDFCANPIAVDENPPIPQESKKRAPNPNTISVNDLPRLDDEQCAEISKTAISQLARYMGFDEVADQEIDMLHHVLHEHLTEMMNFYACIEQRRRDKQQCAFKSNAPQQVLISYGVRHPGVLRDYYDLQIRAVRDRWLKKAEASAESRTQEADRTSTSEDYESEDSEEQTLVAKSSDQEVALHFIQKKSEAEVSAESVPFKEKSPDSAGSSSSESTSESEPESYIGNSPKRRKTNDDYGVE